MKPKLRFQGFHDDWEEKKLGEVAEYKRGPFGSALKKSIFDPNGKYVVYEQNNAIYKTKNTRYKINDKTFLNLKTFSVSDGDILMSGAGTVGKMYEIKKPFDKGVFNQALIRIRVNDKINKKYFMNFFASPIGINILGGKNAGSVIKNLVPIKELKSINIFLPSLLEQGKIGQFFSLLDDRIEKQEQKIALLKERKKGWMQQLFSQTIRFKDENGQDYPAWEEKKLEEVLEEQYKGKKSKESENGNLLLTTDYLDNREYSYVDELNNVNSKDILILWDGSQAGRVYTGYEGVLGSTFMKVSTYDYISSNYIYHFLNYNKKLIQEKWRTGSGIPHVSKDFISSFLISLPSLPEQEKIAEFLSKQDELIEKEEEKLSLLKEQKKGFLQQMFV